MIGDRARFQPVSLLPPVLPSVVADPGDRKMGRRQGVPEPGGVCVGERIRLGRHSGDGG